MTWQLPDGFRQPIEDLDLTGMMLLRRGDYSEAFAIQESRYKLILDRQRVEGRRLHKGSPLLRQGICLIARQRPRDALQKFIEAFIEDVLSESDIDLAKRLPAYSMLADDGFALELRVLDIVAEYALARVEGENLDPYKLMSLALASADMTVEQFLATAKGTVVVGFAKFSIDKMPGKPEERVFLGGSYGNHVVLNRLENIVIELGYQPIIADQFVPRAGADDRSHCTELLKACRYAVFEISMPDGWPPEVEYAFSHEKQLKLYFQGVEPSRHVSSYYRSYPLEGYRNFDELKDKMRSFLSTT